jgi:hypothetical protein
MRSIVTGAVLIGIGFVNGSSVFMGDFTPFNLVFDGLGAFFIVKGAVQVYKSKQAA